MRMLQKNERINILSKLSLNFVSQSLSAFSDSAGPILVSNSAYAVKNVPSRLPTHMGSNRNV